MRPSRRKPDAVFQLYTIGHSTHPIDEFLALLRQVAIGFVVDVRAFPRSRTNPQFNVEALPGSLAAVGIGYEHLRGLGGRRHHGADAPPSPNTLWRNESFRNYADYAATGEFRAGLDKLRALIHERRCAIMCSEAVWWRCHRRIIADYLLAEGVSVGHIMGPNSVQAASLTPGAHPLTDGTILYSDDAVHSGGGES